MLRVGALTLTLLLMGTSAAAQDAVMETVQDSIVSNVVTSTQSVTTPSSTQSGNNVPIAATPLQEKCITIMSGFPDNGHVPRYQFFKLTQELTKGVDSTFRSSLDYFGDSFVTPETPVTDVIENIANPVFRQAAPEITIGNMGYLIDFALDCESYLGGQIESLEAYDSTLKNSEFNTVIAEDALFMRQILSDSMFRVGAQDHEIFGPYVHAYAGNLVTTRDEIEFAGFEAEMESIEAMFLTDLDGRLARSNDIINNEMDRETLANSVEIADDLNREAKKQRKMRSLHTLSQILNGGR